MINRQARDDLSTNSGGDGGGSGGGLGITYDLMSKEPVGYANKKRKKKHGIYKKIKPDPLEHPGEPENTQV